MGLDACAEVIIGVAVEREKLKKFWMKEISIRGCNHDVPEIHRYCFECGAPRVVNTKERNDQLYEQFISERKFFGLQVAFSDVEQSKIFILGKYYSTTESHRQGSTEHITFVPLNIHRVTLEQIHREIFDVLNPLGLYDPGKFGLYGVLFLSY
jgi:hypothetical protein